MFRGLALNAISGAGLERPPPDRYAAGDAAAEPDAVLVRSRDPHDFPIPPTVKGEAAVLGAWWGRVIGSEPAVRRG